MHFLSDCDDDFADRPSCLDEYMGGLHRFGREPVQLRCCDRLHAPVDDDPPDENNRNQRGSPGRLKRAAFDAWMVGHAFWGGRGGRGSRLVLARNVINLRHARCLSQAELAARSGLDRSYVGSSEQGQRNVSIDNIDRLAEALRVDAHDLLAPAGQPERLAELALVTPTRCASAPISRQQGLTPENVTT